MCSWRLYAEYRKKILTWISPRFHGTRSVTVLGRNLLTPCTTARGPTSNRRTGPKFAKSTLRRTLLISRVCFRTIGYTKKSIKLRRDAADGTQCRPKKPRHPTTTSRAPAQAPAMPAHSPSRRRKFGRRSLAHEKRERSRVGEPKYISLKRTNLLKCYI